MGKSRLQGRWLLNNLGMALGWVWGTAWVCFWLYTQVIIWVFPKLQFLPDTFPASHPSVRHLHFFICFFFCILTHFSL